MKSIWKFAIEITDQQTVSMPAGSRLLTVQAQRNEVCIWARVNPEAKRVGRRIAIFGTGHMIPDDFDGTYIGTVQSAAGQLVWHVFDGGAEL